MRSINVFQNKIDTTTESIWNWSQRNRIIMIEQITTKNFTMILNYDCCTSESKFPRKIETLICFVNFLYILFRLILSHSFYDRFTWFLPCARHYLLLILMLLVLFCCLLLSSNRFFSFSFLFSLPLSIWLGGYDSLTIVMVCALTYRRCAFKIFHIVCRTLKLKTWTTPLQIHGHRNNGVYVCIIVLTHSLCMRQRLLNLNNNVYKTKRNETCLKIHANAFFTFMSRIDWLSLFYGRLFTTLHAISNTYKNRLKSFFAVV